MQIAKWGNSLAVRLPAAVVQAMGLKDGDSVDIDIAGTRSLRLKRTMTRAEASEELDRLSVPFPAGFRFSREEANER